MELIIYLAIGAIAGFTAGLFGVGGGLIIVPILYIVFRHQGYPSDVLMHLALGTSLATIMVTSISSIMAHHKKKAVLWPVVKNLAIGLCLGSFLGAGVADLLPNYILQAVIGLFAMSLASKMYFNKKAEVDQSRTLPSALWQGGAGVGIGIASAIFGIGGGSLTVPYLNRHGVVMQQAVATSAACGFPIAVAGAIGFMWFGHHGSVNLPHAIGYVHVYAFIGISCMSFITAKLGAKLAHRLSPRGLQCCFAAMLCVVGCYFIVQALQQMR
ncbi:sulfite exporter TauE/SafE family protein [Acinetobacter rathckeae]|uniref:sulfite exporter TauE/SafE family protein n=1 Tax=Acinetobacter rathckeae TaxID=2605272 RepID=UPI0018A30ABE|nr:sulfite exporter TauE/SafE family protein [Acinetobacter rathckeae]MBF7686807.1 sulfite exporter TauE/SafE family protein [Acinetobacter rathckeae]